MPWRPVSQNEASQTEQRGLQQALCFSMCHGFLFAYDSLLDSQVSRQPEVGSCEVTAVDINTSVCCCYCVYGCVCCSKALVDVKHVLLFCVWLW